jgi:hypothetical protein
MYCGEIDNTYISLAWKLGLHPSTLAPLSSITKVISKSSYLIDHYTTRRTSTGKERFSYAIYMYCGETDGKNILVLLGNLACIHQI